MNFLNSAGGERSKTYRDAHHQRYTPPETELSARGSGAARLYRGDGREQDERIKYL